MHLEALAFPQGADIPMQFNCDGANVSPALRWDGAPTGVETLALVMDDPDAPGGTWVHWVLYDLPATAREPPEGVGPTDRLPGRNDFGIERRMVLV
jgi:Raf kinase inhibitor-like YbhB/YbcL family protein